MRLVNYVLPPIANTFPGNTDQLNADSHTAKIVYPIINDSIKDMMASGNGIKSVNLQLCPSALAVSVSDSDTRNKTTLLRAMHLKRSELLIRSRCRRLWANTCSILITPFMPHAWEVSIVDKFDRFYNRHLIVLQDVCGWWVDWFWAIRRGGAKVEREQKTEVQQSDGLCTHVLCSMASKEKSETLYTPLGSQQLYSCILCFWSQHGH